MRTQFLIISSLLVILFITSCGSSPVMTRATGLANEIVVVMDQGDWESNAGVAVKSELETAVPGLPQVEPSLKITYATPANFNGLLTYVRNIIVVNIDEARYTKVSVKTEFNRWANGQAVVTVNAPDRLSLSEYMDTNRGRIVNFFVQVERNRTLEQLEKNYSTIVMDILREKHNVMVNAPANMTYYRDSVDFFWCSNNANTGRTDLIVYTFPYTDPNTFTEEYLVAKRDSVLKKNLPGAFPDSYMTTESRFGLAYTPITVRGKYCGELRGLWKMVGDMMGGPFVSHARLDEENNRVVVVEGFVFAPETTKRNFIRRIEAALYTLRLPGEFDQPVDPNQKNTDIQ